jgi:hypothetical protein
VIFGVIDNFSDRLPHLFSEKFVILSFIKIGYPSLTMPDQVLIVMPLVLMMIFYTIKYVLIMGLVIKLYVFKPKPSPGKDNKDDDEDDGGNSGGFKLPKFDPPPGGHSLEDLLVDRPPREYSPPVKSPERISI